jgi:hypothetical protein
MSYLPVDLLPVMLFSCLGCSNEPTSGCFVGFLLRLFDLADQRPYSRSPHPPKPRKTHSCVCDLMSSWIRLRDVVLVLFGLLVVLELRRARFGVHRVDGRDLSQPCGAGCGCNGFERVIKLQRQVGNWLSESDGATIAIELCEATLFRCADAGEEVK